MMTLTRLSVVLAAVLALSACESAEKQKAAAQAAADVQAAAKEQKAEELGRQFDAKYAEKNWTLAAAQTDSFLSDDTEFWVDLYSAAPTGCGSQGTGNSVILTVPNKLGSHALSLQLNGTFVLDNAAQDNLVATDGAIRVDEIADTRIRGGVSMTFDAANSISGEFEATICPP